MAISLEPALLSEGISEGGALLSAAKDEEQVSSKEVKKTFARTDLKKILDLLEDDIIKGEISESDSEENFRENSPGGDALFEKIRIIDRDREKKRVEEWQEAAEKYAFSDENSKSCTEESIRESCARGDAHGFCDADIGDQVIRRVRMAPDEDEDIVITYDSKIGGYGVLIRIHDISNVSVAEGEALCNALELTQVGQIFDDSDFDAYIENSRKDVALEHKDTFLQLTQITRLSLDDLSAIELSDIVESEIEQWTRRNEFSQRMLQNFDSSFEQKNLTRRHPVNVPSRRTYDEMAWERLYRKLPVAESKRLQKKCYLANMSNNELAELVKQLIQLKLRKLVDLRSRNLDDDFQLPDIPPAVEEKIVKLGYQAELAPRESSESEQECEERNNRWEEEQRESLKREWQINKWVQDMWERISKLRAHIETESQNIIDQVSRLREKGPNWRRKQFNAVWKRLRSLSLLEQDMTGLKTKMDQLGNAEQELAHNMKRYKLAELEDKEKVELIETKNLKEMAQKWKAKFGLKGLTEKRLDKVRRNLLALQDARADVQEYGNATSAVVESVDELSKKIKRDLNKLKRKFELEDVPESTIDKLRTASDKLLESENELLKFKQKYKLMELSEKTIEEMEIKSQIERLQLAPPHVHEMKMKGRRFVVLTPNNSKEKLEEEAGKREENGTPMIRKVGYSFWDDLYCNVFLIHLNMRDADEMNPCIVCTYYLPFSQLHLQKHDSEALTFLVRTFRKREPLSVAELWTYLETHHQLLRSVRIREYENTEDWPRTITIQILPIVPIPEGVPSDIKELLARGSQTSDDSTQREAENSRSSEASDESTRREESPPAAEEEARRSDKSNESATTTHGERSGSQ